MKSKIIHTTVVFVVTIAAAFLCTGVPGSLSNQCFADGSSGTDSSGEAEAIFQQAKKLPCKDGVPEDADKAVALYRQAAELGHAEAQFIYGSCFYNGEGVKWLRKAADQGDSYATAALGMCYYRGEGVPEDKTEGIKLLRKAAKKGHVRAKEMLKDIESANDDQ